MSENWWRTGAIYHIYPRSFQDSNGDGVGDLEGIRRRLDYLTWLGVDAIWISPFYPSPMHDFGYDVADYCGVDPIFGSLEFLTRSLLTPMRAASRSFSISYRTTPRSSIPGSGRAARGRGRNATGISGATARLRAGRPTIGWRISAVPPGPSTRRAGSIIITHFCRSSPISIGAIRRCARRCSRSCVSGCGAAPMGFAST